MTRKRKFGGNAIDTPLKRRRAQIVNNQENIHQHSDEDLPVSHEVLSLYYPRIVSLRQFLNESLPFSSFARRRRVSIYSSDGQAGRQKCHLFDSTLVGVFPEAQATIKEARKRDFLAFTQSQQKSTDESNESTQHSRFAEIVEHAVWTLFNKAPSTFERPKHVLCHGFYKVSKSCSSEQTGGDACMIPGLASRRRNENFRLLKQSPWSELPSLLGNTSIDILQNLLLDCGIFIPLESGKDNFYQLSGIPLSNLKEIHSSQPSLTNIDVSSDAKKSGSTSDCRSPAEIIFVRTRMFHSKPALNARGDIRFGIKHIHVFNRYPHHDILKHVVHNMKYVFPRQFGLHNVFTSTVNKKDTVQSFKDYTLREHEIVQRSPLQLSAAADTSAERQAVKVPKRLRGGAHSLVRKILKNHHLCSYAQLLRHYCSIQATWPGISATASSTQSQRFSASSIDLAAQAPVKKSSVSASEHGPLVFSHHQSSSPIVGYATPAANVSAFCKSTMRELLPRDTFGIGGDGARNKSKFMACIDRFVSMRRFESLSLHEVVQNIKFTSIPWLRPPKIKESAKMSNSDRRKRLEIFLELLYYLFDSILIPLVRSNFYVTESSTHRNQLFYFRHDIWRKISEPSLAVLKIRVFEVLNPHSASQLFRSGSLGFSHVRLLPKTNTFRPIINLKRRAMEKSGGIAVLGQSINKLLEPISNILNYEKSHESAKLGSALFSVGELHDRLRAFKRGLSFADEQPLYFVKVDVQTCFDTIPQARLLKLVQKLISANRYEIIKHAEIKAGDERWTGTAQKPARKFVGSAHPAGDFSIFSSTLANALAQSKKRTIFNSTGNPQACDTMKMLKLLQEHVEQNVVKIGKRYYRQKHGIPQGSVLSSLLCSFFYGDFETKRLHFLAEGESLLSRLIDDFLLVTTNENHARRFLQLMVDGSEEYGISVNTGKSLANFEILVNESKIPRLHGSMLFPYCGMLIDTRTLEVSKDRTRKDALLSNTLTVDYDRRPGHNFHRKVLMSLRIQMHAMVLDTSLNTPALTATAMYENFTEAAMKMHRYLMSLPRRKRPNGNLVMMAIDGLMKFANNSTRGVQHPKLISEWTCSITTRHVEWLAATAFEDVLRRKQTAYLDVICWLRDLQRHCESSMSMSEKSKKALVDGNRRVFKDFKF